MKLLRIESLAELRRVAGLWDDLWWRSDCYLPTHRAELLAQWLEHFAVGKRFVVLAVEADGQFVAALPLVGQTKAGIVPVGTLASNCWSESGGLLLDAQAPIAAVNALLGGIRRLRWPLLILDATDQTSPPWAALADGFAQRGTSPHWQPQYHVGLIDITHDWEGYVAALSGNHRSAVKRSLRKAQHAGELVLHQHANLLPNQIEPLLHQAFEIEDRSWKGEAGTSILRTPGMIDFFLRQAQQLAEWGQLELLLLTLDGRPIAFEYCYTAKGVTASHKIGYDEEFKQFGPGRLLRFLQLETYFNDPNCRLLDTLGIMCESKAKWCTRSYAAGRLLLPTDAFGAFAHYAAYTRFWPLAKRLLGREEEHFAPPKLGAADAIDSAEAVSSGEMLLAQG